MNSSLNLSRRRFVLAAGGVLLVPSYAWPLGGGPDLSFGLGIASGAPSATSVVLWTRLVSSEPGPALVDADTLPVEWEVARDAHFTTIIRRGTYVAERQWAHSVHAEVKGLEPDTWYWYRFRVDGIVSPTGRTRTLPAIESRPERLRFVFSSCQRYETGFYAAHRHIAAEQPDLVIFLGDYIYEGAFRKTHARAHETEFRVATSLEGYRARYTLYKSDRDLQQSHACCPWLLSWDDHEVVNDYPGHHPLESLLPRRAAAYQAFWEHMPLPLSARPDGYSMRLHERYEFGDLARIHVLDGRQYRSRQVPVTDGEVDSSMLHDTRRTMLGESQELWLQQGLAQSPARWNIVAQQTLVAPSGTQYGERYRIRTDRWDGYPAARARLVKDLGRCANPVLIGGDVHCYWAGELNEDQSNARSPTVATEFVSTSISSTGPRAESVSRCQESNPHLRYGNGARRGYVRVDVTPARIQTQFRAVHDVMDPASGIFTLATFDVAPDRPGPIRVS